jgi:hypothetical protein
MSLSKDNQAGLRIFFIETESRNQFYIKSAPKLQAVKKNQMFKVPSERK